MLDRIRTWLSDEPDAEPDQSDDAGWGLSLWWGAVIVALFTVAISICNDPAPVTIVAAPSEAPADAPATTLAVPARPNLLQTIIEREDLSFFRSLISAGGIDTNIAQGGPFTFFAPTDSAFDELDPEVRDAILADPNAAITVLGSHVAVGLFSAADLLDMASVPSGTEEVLPVTESGGIIYVDNMGVLEADIESTNGILHIVDSVRSTLQALGEQPGEPTVPSVSQIVDSRQDLTTLVTALGAADDATLLDADEAGFTLFAPTDDAFAELPAGSIDVLVATQPKLIELLGYHVVAGRFLAGDLTDGQVLTTSSGAELEVSVDGEIISVGGVVVSEADIVGANGVVHIVDGVLIPPDYSLPTVNEALGLDPITFEVSSATITPEGIDVLASAVEFLTANPDVRVAIEGHTDSQGGEAANQSLSEARAESVRVYLVGEGIAAVRLETAGFGESNPIADNGTAQGRAQNRRIEFRLL